jgi:serine/threonine protein kinase
MYSREKGRESTAATSEKSVRARLQDFVILRMVGKGTFGKVYLVQHQLTRQVYAMKCIRKDIVIDNE